ncbi:MAG: hypothetical protein K6F25_02680 [Bacteroidales bacterium]|nr:hypothetical protein [Bacteroidales bacterium]
MSASWSKFLQVLAVLMVVSGVLLWSDLHRRDTRPTIVVKTVRDTIILRDTITAYKPVPFNVYVVDTMWVPVTVNHTDTIWAQLPRTAKVYQDSTYRAVVSGFRPSLDTISVYQRTKVITVTNNVRIPPPRWSWGVQAALGVNTGGTVTPYLGIGIQYRLGDFEIGK